MPGRSQADDWIALVEGPIPVEKVLDWARRPDCGAVVTFSGVVRDHSEGRAGVVQLEYEAYVEQVEPRLEAVAAEARRRWTAVGRLALLHRVGVLAVGETSVVVAVSTPHRAEAFAAAAFCIDTVKSTVPIWKLETWAGGTTFSDCTHPLPGADRAAAPIR